MTTFVKGTGRTSHIIIALMLVYVVWGSTYLAIRYAVETMPPFLMAGFRFLLAGGMLYVGLSSFGRHPQPSFRQWRSAFIVGTFLLLGGNGLVVWAEQSVNSGMAALMVSIVPLWMVFFEWAGPAKQSVSRGVVWGLILGFFGVVLLVSPQLSLQNSRQGWGLVALIFAPILWAFGSVWSKRMDLPASPFMATAMEMMGGGAALLMVSVILGEHHRVEWAHITSMSWVAFFYLVVMGSLVGFSAYIWLIMRAPMSIAGTYAFVNPVVAIFLGWLLAHEQLTWTMVAAGAIVLLAVIIITIRTPTAKVEE